MTRQKLGENLIPLQVEIWVCRRIPDKRTFTGKLEVDDQNLIYCVRFEENVQKPFKKLIPRNVQISSVFGRYLHMETRIFNPIAALRSYFKCASFEYQHHILNWIFDFIRVFKNFTQFVVGRNVFEIIFFFLSSLFI